jgi:hypothetical protein
MSPFVTRSFFTNKCRNSHWTSLQEIAFEEVLRISSNYVFIDWSILFKAFQFSPLALRWLWRPTRIMKWLYLGDDTWPIIVNIHAPHLNSKKVELLQKMHVYISFGTIKWTTMVWLCVPSNIFCFEPCVWYCMPKFHWHKTNFQHKTPYDI